MAAADGKRASSKQRCSDIQITVRIKECPQSKKSIISKVARNPQVLKLHDEFFTFDHIKWENESQEQVYKAAAYPFVEKALRGQSVTILAYGPSGTGKSYTMGSLISNWQNSGLIQRCLKQIFEENKVQVSASFVEIYNKKLHDLFNMKAKVHRSVTWNSKIEKIKSLEEGLQLVNRALRIRQEHRISNSSLGNTYTSQSHACLTLHLKIEDGDKFLESKLNLVDLAGSKISTQTEAERYVAGGRSYLDESLSALNKVITERCFSKSDPMLSSKDSMLASILKDMMNAKCLVSLIACVSADPASDCRSTFRTLQLAENMKTVQHQHNVELGSALSTNSLIPKTEEIPVGPTPELQNTENIDSQDEKPVITPFQKKKLKNCTVVLKKSDVDLYANKRGVTCEEHVSPLNLNEEQTEREEIPLANVEAVYTAETKSTLSISKLETQNADSETFIKNDLSSPQYNKSSMCCFDDSLSLSSLEGMATMNPKMFHKHNDDVSDSECQCAFLGFQSPMVFIPLSQSSSRESLDENENILTANVSQLSIAAHEIVDFECQSEKQAATRTEDVRNADRVFEKQKALHSSAAIRVNKMKRMNAILTTDFSEAGPSRIDNEIPRKIMKLDDQNLALGFQRVTADLHQKSEDIGSDDDHDNRDNIENREKELNDKQNAHNKHILRILNTCTAEQLTDLPRIGFKTAVSIYQYRLIHGDFESLQSLLTLPIWTEKQCKNFFAANNVFFE